MYESQCFLIDYQKRKKKAELQTLNAKKNN